MFKGSDCSGDNVVHCDLKPGNIFLTQDGDFKVGDFSYSRPVNQFLPKSTTTHGSMGYLSPEWLDGDKEHTKEKDVFALGCVLVELIDLVHPFGTEDIFVQQSRVFSGKVNSARADLSSTQREVRDFALGMILVLPGDRHPIGDLLKHPKLVSYKEKMGTTMRK